MTSNTSAGGWTLRKRFSIALGTIAVVIVTSLYGVRLMGKAATFHFLERNHMELALRIDAALANVENEAKNAGNTRIEDIADQLKQTRKTAVEADNEIFAFEQFLFRALGFGPLIDLPKKDISDVEGMEGVLAAYSVKAGAMPRELAVQLRPGMNAILENSIQFAPLTSDAARFIKITVSILSLIGAAILMATAISLRQRTLQPLATAIAAAQRVASGDLTEEIEARGNDEAGMLMTALGSMVSALRELVKEINTGANDVVQNAERISVASREVSLAAEHQADATSAMAAAIEELTVSSNHISASASDTEQDSLAAMTEAAEGSQRVEQATIAIQKIAATVAEAARQIHELEDRTKQVSSIANVIKDIAGQTNLLALNAAIEAARAGEQGRGFAVVADEVRKLAERTSSATIEIEQMIVGIQKDTIGAVSAMNSALPEVEQGVELAGSASDSLRAIEVGAGRTLGRIREVANATREQSSASTSIAQRVETIAQMVEETSSTMRGTAETADQLELIAHGLKGKIERFQV
ncbi:MAG: methyl-accepting chemotaxis protein [Proteobacteria bacterium]|nr:methyl-accepting chemotaxis protein [Pseudomonadota bacterium]